jgi:Cu+-exporting ATPase
MHPSVAERRLAAGGRALTARVWVAVPLTGALAALSLAQRGLGQPPVPPWLALAAAAPVVLWCAWPLYREAVTSVLRRTPTRFTLLGPGVAVAFACGMIDVAAALVTAVLVGQLVELRVRARLRAAVPALRVPADATAHRTRADGSDEEVALRSVRVGDHLPVRPGDVIPVDGTVVDGVSAASEGMFSGESLPVSKRPGARVAASTINGSGSLVVRAEKIGADTLAARVDAWIAGAQASPVPFQRRADRLARALVSLVPAIALIVLVTWSVVADAAWTDGMPAALAVALVASPWALDLTTPIAALVAIGKAAAMGIVVRDAAAIEALRRADVLVIDKTGTLTEGKPRLVAVRPTVGFDKQQVLRLAASLDRASRHPLAIAIVAAAEEAGIALHDVTDVCAIPGQGIRGRVGKRSLLLGNRALMDAAGVELDDLPQRAEPLRAQGQTVMFLAVDGRPAGFVSVADPIKPRTQEAVATLHHEGVRIVLLTSDSSGTAASIGRAAGVDEIHADLAPEQKLGFVAGLRAQGHVVAMAGDGFGDVRALAGADVAIAMGTGTDVAIDDAHVTLLHGELHGIARARVLSRLTMTSFRQNLAFAATYNAVAIAGVVAAPFAGADLEPSPTLAAIATTSAAMAVLGNALRLRSRRL